MKTVSKRGAALAIVIVVSAAILILSAALVSAAVYNVGSSQNSLEGRQAYLQAKSAIEFGKAYVKKNPGCGDFKVVANSDSDSGFSIGTGNPTDYLANYESGKRTIHANVKYQSSDRRRKLKYTFPALLGGAPAYFDVGKQHGKTQIFNSSYDLSKTDVDAPVVAKSTVKLNSTINDGFKADQIYFMGSGNCLEVTALDAAITLKSDFIYFNADICAVSNYERKLEIEPKNNKAGIAYFNHVKLKMGTNDILKNSDGSDSYLDGYYLFSGTLNLFDDYDSFTKLKEEQVIDKLNGEKFTGEELITSKKYAEGNYIKMLTGDQDGAGWTGEGNIRDVDATLLDQQGKSVYMYIIDSSDWNNGNNLNRKYKADEIHMQFVNDNAKNFVFPADKTVTFMADEISMNTQKADDDVGEGDSSKPEIEGTGGACCVLKSQNGKNDFYVTFHYKTTVRYTNEEGNEETYDIKPGKYHITESKGYRGSGVGLDLFTPAAQNYFASAKSDPVGSTGGSGGAGSAGGYGDE